MNKFKKWLIPVALVCVLLASLVGCSSAPASLGEIFDPSGNPFANRFSDVKDIRTATFVIAALDSEHKYEADYRCNGTAATGGDQVEINKAIEALISSVTDEAFNSGALDVWVTLDNNRIQRGEVVTSNGITYVRGVDYEMDYSAGMIMCLSTGGMAAATEFYIDYEYGGGCVKLLDGTFWVNDVIRVRSHVQLIGNGFGSIIKVEDGRDANLHIIDNYDQTNGNDNIVVSDLALDGNKYLGAAVTVYAVYFKDVASSVVKNCYMTNIRGYGTRFQACNNCIGTENISRGIKDYSFYLFSSTECTISNNICWDSLEHVIYLTGSTNNVINGNIVNRGAFSGIYLTTDSHYNIISNNLCFGNAYNGIHIRRSDYNIIIGNTARQNGYHGIDLEDSHHNIVSNNICTENSQDTDVVYCNIFTEQSDYNLISDNTCRKGALANKPGRGISISDAASEKNIIQGNDLYDSGSTSAILDNGACTIIEDDNRDIEITDVKQLRRVKQTSGGALVRGDVVSLKAIAAGNEVTTPAAGGEDQVYGMLAENIADGAFGYVQVGGKTVYLKATNAVGGNIAIGDFLCTEVGNRAMKAAAGDMAFAIALEVCNAADVTIDALIIVPRKI